ncbi:MAG: RNA polymerase sigma factor [Kofleriaceae bacterium]
MHHLVLALQLWLGMTPAELVTKHRAHLSRLARQLCGNAFDAEDLVHDVVESMLRRPVPELANERAWLGRVLRNRFIDRLRRSAARREEPLADRELAEEPPAGDVAGNSAAVAVELARLPAPQRETLALFALESRSYEEIAAQLGIAKATVGTRILRARRTLTRALAA